MTVSVIDTASNGVASHPSGSFVYVTNQFEGKVRIVDTVTNSVVGSIQVGNDPLGIAVSHTPLRSYLTEGCC